MMSLSAKASVTRDHAHVMTVCVQRSRADPREETCSRDSR